MSSHQTINVNLTPRTVITFFAILAAIGAVYLISDILLLIFVSIVVSAALEPSVNYMEKRRLPRWLAVTILYLLLLGFFVLMGLLIVPRVAAQIREISSSLPHLQDSFNHSLDGKPYLHDLSISLIARLTQNSSELVSRLAGVTVGVVSSIFGIITFLVLTFYMLVGGKNISVGVINALIPSEQSRQRFFKISSQVSNRMGWWLRGQFFVAMTTFVAVLVGLGVLRVEFALTLALIAGMMEFVPIIGSYLGAIPALLVALTVSPTKALAVLLFFIVWQSLQAHIIVPQIMKRVLGVPALLIFLAVLVFGRLLGFIGIILAAPITGAITVVVDEFSSDVKDRLKANRLKKVGSRAV